MLTILQVHEYAANRQKNRHIYRNRHSRSHSVDPSLHVSAAMLSYQPFTIHSGIKSGISESVQVLEENGFLLLLLFCT